MNAPPEEVDPADEEPEWYEKKYKVPYLDKKFPLWQLVCAGVAFLIFLIVFICCIRCCCRCCKAKLKEENNKIRPGGRTIVPGARPLKTTAEMMNKKKGGTARGRSGDFSINMGNVTADNSTDNSRKPPNLDRLKTKHKF